MNRGRSAMPTPRVSVAMATYNGARFVAEQLRSLSAQTLLPSELVVSDDGSSDDTMTIVRDYAMTAPFRVRVLDKSDRLGFGDNFLFAIENCLEEVVALSDQDDIWSPDKLEKGVTRLLSDDSLLSMHQLTMTDELLRPIGVWNQGICGNRRFTPLELNPLSGWGNSMVIRRELALMAPRGERPWDPLYGRPLSHDTWLYILAAALGNVSHIAEPLILYRQHGANVAGMRRSGAAQRLRTAITAPLATYRGRTTFFAELASVFDRIATRRQSDAANAAHAAADRYRTRSARLGLRAQIYDGAAVADRLRAFIDLHTTRDPDMPGTRARALSFIKDVGLGLPAIGYRA